ncbi:uracil-DNA glycosylase-like protein [Auriculariales sp. MPI-PUGE-AT-0066]|nr:uracil-DNA glycosylase-like protein [Auriculariales sp. MPI-PUGE-AT-0066]
MSASADKFVFLEDLLIPGSKASAASSLPNSQASAASDADPSDTTKQTSATAKAGEKRQGSISTFFTSKKLKTTDGSAAQSSTTATTGAAVSASKAVARPLAGRLPQKLNQIPFSLSGFRNSLSPENAALLRLEMETMSPIWLKMLAEEIKKPYFIKLKGYLRDQGLKEVDDPNPTMNLKVFPPAGDIYSWSRFTPLGKVRVVILGQDPYHTPRFAHGLSFSVRHGISIPKSLENIYKELKSIYPEFVIPKHGNLEAWAAQGVLMLNTCLSVRPSEANSHSNQGWEQFTAAVISVIDRYGGAALRDRSGEMAGVGKGVVFMAWGRQAQNAVAKLSKTKHLILESVHPSPLSAHRGFFGNAHFRKANEWLEQRFGPEAVVDWTKLDNTLTET